MITLCDYSSLCICSHSNSSQESDSCSTPVSGWPTGPVANRQYCKYFLLQRGCPLRACRFLHCPRERAPPHIVEEMVVRTTITHAHTHTCTYCHTHTHTSLDAHTHTHTYAYTHPHTQSTSIFIISRAYEIFRLCQYCCLCSFASL